VLALSLGFTLSGERAAALSTVLSGLEMTPIELERVTSRLLYDETLAETLRFGRGITPLDFKRVLDFERRAARRREEARWQGQRQAHSAAEMTRRGIEQYTQVEPPALRGKKDNIQRLEAGSPSTDRETPEWHEQWGSYFKRPYVTDAQDKARQQISDYEATKDEVI